jgi:hypothetical protein
MYRATIAHKDNDTWKHETITNVLCCKMLPDRIFYIVGSDFEHWVALGDGQFVTVTENMK